MIGPKDQVGKAQDAVVALLEDHPFLTSDGVTRKQLATVGYHVTKQAEVWFNVGHGRYCVCGVDPAKDGAYGITAKHVWVADDTNGTVRTAPVNAHSGSPDFEHIDLKTGGAGLLPGHLWAPRRPRRCRSLTSPPGIEPKACSQLVGAA